MNPEIKARWIEALRGDRFRQGERKLAVKRTAEEPMKHCCLGVLCELAVEDGIIDAEMHPYQNGTMRHFGKAGDWSTTSLPMAVTEWAGLTGPYANDPVLVETPGALINASELNDGNSLDEIESRSFEEIAALIEEKL